jgi:hypothetical protein
LLNGRVTDESGAVVPAAKVRINGPEIPARTVSTGADGVYAFTGLPPGSYSIAASAPHLAEPSGNDPYGTTLYTAAPASPLTPGGPG